MACTGDCSIHLKFLKKVPRGKVRDWDRVVLSVWVVMLVGVLGLCSRGGGESVGGLS